ncbi:hypothetical protein Tneu_0868 [Pyrobaculum neutrophilum V24Sta]|uniref:Uncharacterized protein n=2 Tax=Pyrobaculum neutrophilum TaxID=70771 RepID=B1YDE2_PYRNV|nr:hypothetical protein Tneu_0868 [Pyrobaculum neutrophilum V24Sta]
MGERHELKLIHYPLSDGDLYLFTRADDAVTLLSLFDNQGAGDLLREWTPELAPVWDRLEELARETRVEYSEEDMKFFEAAGIRIGRGPGFRFGPVITPKGRISIPDNIINALYERLNEERLNHNVSAGLRWWLGCVADLGCIGFATTSQVIHGCRMRGLRLGEEWINWLSEALRERNLYLSLSLPGSYCQCVLMEINDLNNVPSNLTEAVEFADEHYRPGERRGRCVCVDNSCRETEPDLRRLEELLDVYLRRLHRAIWRGLAVVERGVRAWEESSMLKATTEELKKIVDEIYDNLQFR